MFGERLQEGQRWHSLKEHALYHNLTTNAEASRSNLANNRKQKAALAFSKENTRCITVANRTLKPVVQMATINMSKRLWAAPENNYYLMR